MTNAERLKILTESGRSVFSSRELQDFWQIDSVAFKLSAKRMVEKGLIIRIAKGYFSLSENFNIHELANLIITPSYVSLHTALVYHSIAFQLSDTVSSVALLNYERKIGDRVYKYYTMKESLFLNLEGIIYKNNLAIATVERAILDAFYFGALPNLDNFDAINLHALEELSFYYPKVVQKEVKQLLK